MGENTSIRLPKNLRDRLNVRVAEEARRTRKKFTQADWIEKYVELEEKK